MNLFETLGDSLRPENSRIDSQSIEINKLKKALIKSCQAFKKSFEFTWDADPDLTTEEEQSHYKWVLVELSGLGSSVDGNYQWKIELHENELPFESNPDEERDFKQDR